MAKISVKNFIAELDSYFARENLGAAGQCLLEWRERAKEKLAELLGLPFEKPSEDKFSAEASYTKDGFLYTPFSFQNVLPQQYQLYSFQIFPAPNQHTPEKRPSQHR